MSDTVKQIKSIAKAKREESSGSVQTPRSNKTVSHVEALTAARKNWVDNSRYQMVLLKELRSLSKASGLKMSEHALLTQTGNERLDDIMAQLLQFHEKIASVVLEWAMKADEEAGLGAPPVSKRNELLNAMYLAVQAGNSDEVKALTEELAKLEE